MAQRVGVESTKSFKLHINRFAFILASYWDICKLQWVDMKVHSFYLFHDY